ncbi:hypothetical protein P691DRAFT_344338 [Macrolepiota fuliginosa MF-IS2]|uniref:Meiotically up-regulated protein Msb1/Mug8 domain-containing protein n=1 Tax=Macrolepiota fuliginosa MF-IS2 TaxID=1400762 RepID=A0A9P5X672_9AGAR|nr:hypothetical protein P691DRAFT_344338 [Macrolepiota fuliginosa MF-IS2]
MPSLFSRSRTQSTPQKSSRLTADNNSPASLDEFGRVQSRNSNRAFPISVSTPSKKDKKRAKELQKRAKTLGSRADLNDVDPDLPQQPPDGSFLPLSLEPPAAGDQARETDYGYLSYERHVVLGLEQLEVLVSVVADELETRGGITTPFIFSTTALDISASAIKRLIRSFLRMCSAQGSLGWTDAHRAWREEAKFAGPHELGMCLRWGLARVVRVMGGHDVRGLISREHYVKFRDSEAARGYPPGHFEAFLEELEPTLQIIIVRVLSLLARLTANSTSSGHTPPTLSPLFGPLLFGLGPATLAFHHTYIHYLRAVNATEHLLLAFIRWQDTPRLTASYNSNSTHPSGSAAALGVPIRLKEWIKGYPAMLHFLHDQKNVKPQPRKGAKTTTVTSVRRNVRMYSPDLVKTAATWAHRINKSGNGIMGGLANSKEWERIAPATLKLPPRYSETYKKRMNLPSNFHPEIAPGIAFSASGGSSASSTLASTLTIGTVSQANSGSSDKDYFGLGRREGEDRFRSLTDLKWGEFESMGFSNIGDDKKLQFDLTESAREERVAKRQTMSWNDFSTAGFSRTDAPLNTTLQFSTPLTLSVSNWPTRDAELTKKIKKTEKQLPPFGWDTEPVMGGEEIIEEAFVDVFCDLVYGGGWMDLERGEGLDRDVNWALVEFKSLPPNRATVPGGSDPRTATTLILFEEFVPLEYRQQLAVKSTTRRRIPLLFSPSKKQWKQAPTLNGRPYIVGHVPRSPSYREMEFEGLLQGGNSTKVIKAGTRVSAIGGASVSQHAESSRSPPPPVPPLPSQPSSSFPPSSSGAYGGGGSGSPMVPPKAVSPIPPRVTVTTAMSSPRAPRSDEMHSGTSDSTMSPSMKKSASRFKITNVLTVPSPKRMSMVPAEYSAVEFETRLASYSDSERNEGEQDDLSGGEAQRRKRRESRDDAWVDILVSSHSRRMMGQDVDPRAVKGAGAGGSSGGDPDAASLEVAQVLAAVRRERQQRSPSLRSGMSSDGDFVPHSHRPAGGGGGVDMDAHVQGLEIDEIERIPARERRRSVGSDSSAGHHRLARYDEDDEEDEDDEDEDYAADAEGADEEHDHSQDLSHSHAHDVEPASTAIIQGEEPESGLPSVRQVLKQQRRLGYFDLHPERKQLQRPSSFEELDLPQTSPLPDLPTFDMSAEQHRIEAEGNGLARVDSATLPQSAKSNGSPVAASTNGMPAPAVTAHPIGPRAPAATAGAGTKTAALIEMYRERERRAAAAPAVAPVIAVPPSTASSEVVTSTPVSAPAASPAAPAPRTPQRTTSLPGATNANTSISLGDEAVPPAVGGDALVAQFEETGRASPARYIHGAPLHNVLEEEEEED